MNRVFFRAAARTVFLLGLSLLAACDKGLGHDDLPEYQDIPYTPQTERSRFLEEFQLVNYASSQVGAPQAEDGSSPFGALVAFESDYSMGYCSATHIAPGKVATNAHCADDPAENTYFVYYGKDRRKHACQASAKGYVGNEDKDDIAIFQIGNACDQQWDVINGQVADTADKLGKAVGSATFDVTVWALDPIRRHSALQSAISTYGMVFRPRHCKGMRAMPTVFGRTGNPKDAPEEIRSSQTNPAIHVVMDRCDAYLMKGNSGSLITLAGSGPKLLGVYHWAIRPSASARLYYDYYEVTGTDGAKADVSPPVSDEDFAFFNVGTLFRNVLDSNPGAF